MASVNFAKMFHGATLVTFKTVELGYSIDGVNVQLNEKWYDLFSDDLGGLEGEPCDSQLLGADGMISVDFLKADQNEIERLSSFEGAGAGGTGSSTAGTLPAYGTFARQDGLAGSLILSAANKTITFPVAKLRGGQSFRAGTKARQWSANWVAWPDSSRRLFIVS